MPAGSTIAALLLAASLPCQALGVSQRWCGPIGPFQICGTAYASANLATPIFAGGTHGNGTLTVGCYLGRHDVCHDPNSGARVVVLVGSHLPAVNAILPAWFTGTGPNRIGVDPVWIVPMFPTAAGNWHRQFPVPSTVQGLTFRYQVASCWAEQNVGYFVQLSNCLDVTL